MKLPKNDIINADDNQATFAGEVKAVIIILKLEKH